MTLEILLEEQRVLNGKVRLLCSVRKYLKLDISPEISSETLAIANFIGLESLDAPDCAVTEDQFNEWLKIHEFTHKLARCFLGNPRCLEQDMEEENLSELDRDLIWLIAKADRELWEVVVLKWKKIDESFRKVWKTEFDNHSVFFRELIAADINGVFEKCFSKNSTFHCRNIIKYYSLAKRQCRGFLTITEQQEFETFKKTLFPKNLLKERLFEILEAAKKHDDLIRAYWQARQAYIDGIYNLFEKACRTGRLSSTTWYKGQLFLGAWSLKQLEAGKYVRQSS